MATMRISERDHFFQNFVARLIADLLGASLPWVRSFVRGQLSLELN
jgi:hypothetical protein